MRDALADMCDRLIADIEAKIGPIEKDKKKKHPDPCKQTKENDGKRSRKYTTKRKKHSIDNRIKRTKAGQGQKGQSTFHEGASRAVGKARTVVR